MGTYVEWVLGRTTYGCLAIYPPPQIERIQESIGMIGHMSLEWKAPTTPAELLNQIPMAQPVSSALFPVPHMKGVFKYNVEQLGQSPVMDWGQFYDLGKQAAEGTWKLAPGVPQIS